MVLEIDWHFTSPVFFFYYPASRLLDLFCFKVPCPLGIFRCHFLIPFFLVLSAGKRGWNLGNYSSGLLLDVASSISQRSTLCLAFIVFSFHDLFPRLHALKVFGSIGYKSLSI